MPGLFQIKTADAFPITQEMAEKQARQSTLWRKRAVIFCSKLPPKKLHNESILFRALDFGSTAHKTIEEMRYKAKEQILMKKRYVKMHRQTPASMIPGNSNCVKMCLTPPATINQEVTDVNTAKAAQEAKKQQAILRQVQLIRGEVPQVQIADQEMPDAITKTSEKTAVFVKPEVPKEQVNLAQQIDSVTLQVKSIAEQARVNLQEWLSKIAPDAWKTLDEDIVQAMQFSLKFTKEHTEHLNSIVPDFNTMCEEILDEAALLVEKHYTSL